MNILQEDINRSIAYLGERNEVFRGRHIVITGATGQIGQYLVALLKKLNEAGYGCTMDIVSRNMEHAVSLFGCTDKNLRFVCHNFMRYGGVFEPSKPADIVIIGASPTSPYIYKNDPVSVAYTNINCTIQMLELAKKCNATVLLCSSSSVYGTVNNRLILEDDYGSLNPVEVTACYSESKRACEMLLSAYHHQFGIVTYITRLRRIYGSTMDIKQKSYLNRVLKAAAYGGTLQTFRDPANKMQLTYITDAINGIVYVLAKGKINTPYNICSSDLVTVDEFTNTAYEIGKKHGMVLQYLEKADVNDEVRKNNRYRNNGMCLADRLESIGWRQMIDYKNGINRAIVALREK